MLEAADKEAKELADNNHNFNSQTGGRDAAGLKAFADSQEDLVLSIHNFSVIQDLSEVVTPAVAHANGNAKLARNMTNFKTHQYVTPDKHGPYKDGELKDVHVCHLCLLQLCPLNKKVI